jgi:hypothetical protein
MDKKKNVIAITSGILEADADGQNCRDGGTSDLVTHPAPVTCIRPPHERRESRQHSCTYNDDGSGQFFTQQQRLPWTPRVM